MCVLCLLLPLQLRSHVDILKKAVKDEQAQRTSLEVCSQPYQWLPPLSCQTDRQTDRQTEWGRKPVLVGQLFSDHILFLCSFPMDYLKEAGDPPLSPLKYHFSHSQESLRERTLSLRKHVQENESLEFRNQQVCGGVSVRLGLGGVIADV